VRLLKAEPYSQKEADAAAGLGVSEFNSRDLKESEMVVDEEPEAQAITDLSKKEAGADVELGGVE
jgi:hypothetical protein